MIERKGKIIRTNDIKTVLDDYYLKYKSGIIEHAYVAFEAQAGFGCKTQIVDWLEKSEIKYYCDIYPAPLYDKKEEITFSDCNLEAISTSGTAVFYHYFNWGRNIKCYPEIEKLFVNRQYTTPFNRTYTYSPFITIITLLPDDSGNRIYPISKNILDLFDFYEVESSLKDTLAYEEMICKEIIEDIANDDEQLLKEMNDKLEFITLLNTLPFDIKHDFNFTPLSVSNALNWIHRSYTVSSFLKELETQGHNMPNDDLAKVKKIFNIS